MVIYWDDLFAYFFAIYIYYRTQKSAIIFPEDASNNYHVYWGNFRGTYSYNGSSVGAYTASLSLFWDKVSLFSGGAGTKLVETNSTIRNRMDLPFENTLHIFSFESNLLINSTAVVASISSGVWKYNMIQYFLDGGKFSASITLDSSVMGITFSYTRGLHLWTGRGSEARKPADWIAAGGKKVLYIVPDYPNCELPGAEQTEIIIIPNDSFLILL